MTGVYQPPQNLNLSHVYEGDAPDFLQMVLDVEQQAQQRGFIVAIMRRGMGEGAATHNCMAVKLADPNKQVLHRNVEKEFILQQASHVRTTNPLLMYSLGVLVVVCCFCFHRLFRISRA